MNIKQMTFAALMTAIAIPAAAGETAEQAAAEQVTAQEIELITQAEPTAAGAPKTARDIVDARKAKFQARMDGAVDGGPKFVGPSF